MKTTGAKIRILFCVWADAANTNAQSLNARDIALRLSPARFESALFVTGEPDPRLVRRQGIRIIRLPPRLRSVAMALQMVWGRYDILFYPPMDYLMDWYRVGVRLGRRKKIVATVEGTAQMMQDAAPAAQERARRVMAEADALCAISPHIAETMRAAYGLEPTVVPIGVDTRLFAPCDRAGHILPARVLYVGSLQPRKRVELLLDLARAIPPSLAGLDIVGDVIGDPSYRERLLQRKADEGLTQVTFHGGLTQAQVRERMRRADVLVLPSRLEGTPKVTLEAAAMGLPCLVFDDYCTPTVVDGVTGFQVRTFEEMLARLQQLIADRDLRLRMGQAAVAHMRQFDWDVVGKQWEAVFESVMR